MVLYYWSLSSCGISTVLAAVLQGGLGLVTRKRVQLQGLRANWPRKTCLRAQWLTATYFEATRDRVGPSAKAASTSSARHAE